MGVVHAGVNDGDDDFAAAGIEVPGLGGIDIGPGSAASLAGVVHAPELAEAGIIRGGRGDSVHEVGLGVTDAGSAVVGCQDLVNLLTGRQCHQAQAGNQPVILLDRGPAQRVENTRALRRLDLGIKPDQQVGFDVISAWCELGKGQKKPDKGKASATREAPRAVDKVKGGLHVGNRAHKTKKRLTVAARGAGISGRRRWAA